MRPCCATCRHFDNSPATLEARIPGLRALGSAYGATRAQDGLCARWERYLSADHVCPDHASCAQELQTGAVEAGVADMQGG